MTRYSEKMMISYSCIRGWCPTCSKNLEWYLTLRLFLDVHIIGHLSHLKSLVFSLCERACRFDFWQSTFCWWDFSPFSPRKDFWHREQLKWVAANGCAAIICSLRAFFVSNKAPHFSQDILFSSLSEYGQLAFMSLKVS